MRKKLNTNLYCTTCTSVLLSFLMSLGVSYAQDNSSSKIETVVVTGQRAAIQSAITLKANADVVVDSVAAEDVGKLPDNSITEVLQRVAGVNISRIQTGGSSESYLGEGTNITIRGLSSTVSLLNGRDSFSAANGRNLAWEDVPPELAQGIDVYKSLSASLPEGGFGGVVNLRTRQPFDFDGFSANLTASGNYADYAKKGRVGGSALISDRWNTKIGEMGLLLNLVYSDLATRADGIQVMPYYPKVYNPTFTSNDTTQLPSLSDSGSKEVYVPGGISFNQRQDDRVRLGMYAAAQWRPTDDLLLFATLLRSRYTLNDTYHAMYVDGAGDTVLSANSTNTFDKYGNLTSTTGLSNYMYISNGSAVGSNTSSGWSYQPIAYDLETMRTREINTTTDISTGGEWQPTDAFNLKFAFQYVNSKSTSKDNAANLYAFLAGYGLSLSPYGDATTPKLTLSDATVDMTNAANYGWLATMDHLRHDKGKEYAGYADSVYTVSDTGFLRSIRSGLKVTYRGEHDKETIWNYQQLTPWFGSGYTDKNHISTANYTDDTAMPGNGIKYLSNNSTLGQLVDLSDLFKGKVGLPSAVYFPTVAAAQATGYLHQTEGGKFDYDEAKDVAAYKPGNTSKLFETSVTAYVAASFAEDNNSIAPFNGNIGVRVVAYRDHASGYIWSPDLSGGAEFIPVTDWPSVSNPNGYTLIGTSSSHPNTIVFTSNSTPTYSEGGHSQVDVLPSFNIQFLPVDNLHIRLAFSQGVSRPTFAQMDPRGSVYGNYVGTYVSYFNGSRGNPDLKPEKANQFDGSIEYYFTNNGLIHFSPFYKRIHNVISTRQADEAVTLNTVISGGAAGRTYNGVTDMGCKNITLGASCPQTVTASMVLNFNESKTASLDGFEVGISKYADFLPEPFNGIGIDFNYTYIDSKQPGALANDMLGQKINNLPMTGLSKNTVNASVMYDKEAFSFRLAYNWRSDFLVSTAAWQTSGNYNYTNTFNYGSAQQQGTPIHFALPVFQYPVGTLDMNMTYKLSDDISWTLEASNLTQSTTRLYMGTGDRRVNRSWYLADTRYTTQIRMKF